jgi:Flp pilus assembly protein TadD
METRRYLGAADAALVTLLASLMLPAALRADAGAPVVQDQSLRADQLMAQGRMREAIPLYRDWLQLRPSDAASHLRLGLCLQTTGQAREARREYEKATKIDRCYADAWNNLGTLDHVRGKCKRAVAAYRQAVQCKPESAAFHRNLGAAYLELGDFPRSAEAYAEALRLDPSSLASISRLGVSINGARLAKRYFEVAKDAARRGQLETALQLLNRARWLGLEDFARSVAGEKAFAKLLADPRYAEQLR